MLMIDRNGWILSFEIARIISTMQMTNAIIRGIPVI